MAAPNDSVIRLDGLLLATDGSEDAMLAARVATDLSQRTGARLHVVHAWLRVLATIAEYIAQMVSDRGHHVRHFVEDFPEALPAER
ncbi:MAG TPA: universal stress protein [Rubrobacter sp.]|jgi:nucleotide-binding universal stress UspA family protein|nr:universal stress protein [Rubrobacter sp.]